MRVQYLISLNLPEEVSKTNLHYYLQQAVATHWEVYNKLWDVDIPNLYHSKVRVRPVTHKAIQSLVRRANVPPR